MPDLSVVIPCYNCEETIARTISLVCRHLDARPGSWELILVDDGSTDDTALILRNHADGERVIAVSLERNRGKGRAVTTGMVRATGTARVFTDADLPYELDAIDRCADRVLAGRRAVFGNRLVDGSDARAQPRLRRWVGAAVRAMIAALLGRRDVDTQCGLKGFSGPLADALFPLIQIDGFLFDAEATLLLTRAGVPISFIRVTLKDQDSSTVHFARTGITTVREAWTLFRIRSQRRDLSAMRAAAGV